LAAPGSDRPLSLPAAALWATALWLLEHIAFEVTEALRPGAITDIVNVSACVVLATSVVVFAMVRIHAPVTSLRATLGVRALGPVSLVLAAVAGLGLCPALSTVDDLVAKRWPYDDPEALESMNKLLGSSTHLGLVLGVFVVIPLAREVFFRGALFGELQRARGIGIGRGSGEGGGAGSTALALVATALLFAVFSLDWRSMPTALVLGLALGWLRARTGSLVAPVVAHLAFWSVEGIPILRGADPAADVTYPTRWIAGGVAAAILALVAIRPAVGARARDGEGS
jgi:membrane protease YdiL (CAAX protease family)